MNWSLNCATMIILVLEEYDVLIIMFNQLRSKCKHWCKLYCISTQ